jgi:hypothetical protein
LIEVLESGDEIGTALVTIRFSNFEESWKNGILPGEE